MSSSSDSRAARRARRSLCTARIFSGVAEEVVADLQSDDETFFGSDHDIHSDEESPPSSPAAKRPRAAESWASDSDTEEDEQDASQQSLHASLGDEAADENADSAESIAARVAEGCKCSSEDHFTVVHQEDLLSIRTQMRAMKTKEKDQFILGILSAGIFYDGASHGGTATHNPRERVKFRYNLFGQTVCREMFMYAYIVGRTHLRRLQHLASKTLCSTSAHGRTGGQAWNTCSAETKSRVSEFIKNYSSVHGLPMPAAPRGRANDAPIFLPASDTYVSMHADYRKAQQADEECVSLSTFKRIWQSEHPDLKFMDPRQDVCAKCEQFRNNLRVMMSEKDKAELSQKWRQHIDLATSERQFYNECIAKSKSDPNALTHITFDFAENFTIPYHSRQPGPVYFKVLFRINDFGVINEAVPEQVHYIYHEGQTIAPDNGKSHGPNCVVSMLHYYLTTHPHADVLHAHCDNCCGQNKNKTVMAYCCWRVLAGLEKDIKLSFMIVGHTRCSVDGGFGLAKKKFRGSDCDTPQHVRDLIESSSTQNKSCLFQWEWRDWDSFLSKKFRRIAGITKFHHFHFSSEFPGQVKMKELLDGPETTVTLSKVAVDAVVSSDLPEVLPPAGLTENRRQYLLDSVLGFCRPEHQDDFKAAL